jgi:hypothetical protein
MSCLILGDSIAYGLSTALKGCAVIAKAGMASLWILNHTPVGHYNQTYISSGSNDPYSHNLVHDLERTRYRISGRVTWILPMNINARRAVAYVANEFHDKKVGFIPGPDYIHPRSYINLAHSIKSI